MKLGTWLCECGCALTHLGFKLKNNVKFHSSATHKSPKCIYSFIVSTLNLLESGLSDETVETMSDLFLFVLISKRPSVSGILYSFLYKYVISASIFKAFSPSFEMNISTSSCPVIVGGIVPVECSLARWNRALYFQIVCGTWEIDEGHAPMFQSPVLYGLDLEN